MNKFFLVVLILLVLSIFVIANTHQEEVKYEPVIVPIYIGDYFTGNVYVKDSTGKAFWCSYFVEQNNYYCKEFGK